MGRRGFLCGTKFNKLSPRKILCVFTFCKSICAWKELFLEKEFQNETKFIPRKRNHAEQGSEASSTNLRKQLAFNKRFVSTYAVAVDDNAIANNCHEKILIVSRFSEVYWSWRRISAERKTSKRIRCDHHLIKIFIFQKNQQQPVIDVIVVLVALPSLTILALLLEANTRGSWLDTPQTRYTVLGLGFALAIVCLSICFYVTSRLGGKMWSGAIPSDGSGPHYSYYVSKASVNNDAKFVRFMESHAVETR